MPVWSAIYTYVHIVTQSSIPTTPTYLVSYTYSSLGNSHASLLSLPIVSLLCIAIKPQYANYIRMWDVK